VDLPNAGVSEYYTVWAVTDPAPRRGVPPGSPRFVGLENDYEDSRFCRAPRSRQASASMARRPGNFTSTTSWDPRRTAPESGGGAGPVSPRVCDPSTTPGSRFACAGLGDRAGGTDYATGLREGSRSFGRPVESCRRGSSCLATAAMKVVRRARPMLTLRRPRGKSELADVPARRVRHLTFLLLGLQVLSRSDVADGGHPPTRSSFGYGGMVTSMTYPVER